MWWFNLLCWAIVSLLLGTLTWMNNQKYNDHTPHWIVVIGVFLLPVWLVIFTLWIWILDRRD